MVEFSNDQSGSPLITTYEDDDKKPLMRHKVKEIGHDFLSLEFDDREVTGAIAETRITAYRLSMLAHVGKSNRNAATTPNSDPLSDKPVKRQDGDAEKEARDCKSSPTHNTNPPKATSLDELRIVVGLSNRSS